MGIPTTLAYEKYELNNITFERLEYLYFMIVRNKSIK